MRTMAAGAPALFLGALLLLVGAAMADPAQQPIPAASTQPSSGGSPTVASVPTPSPFLGIVLGLSAQGVRLQLGKPREILSASIGDVWRFDEDGGNATFDVVIANDVVVDVAIRASDGKSSTVADPYGGALGMTVQALKTARGAPVAILDGGAHLAYGDPAGERWFYTIVNGTVTRIELTGLLPPPPAAQVISDARHDGSTIDRALIVNAATESDGVQAEMAYLGSLTCDGDGRWQVIGQELVPAAGRYYDLLHTVCSVSKHPHDFYFDSTSFYGK